MKFTLSWLKDHLETAASLQELTTRMSAIGLDVEGVDDPAARLAAFRVARVVEAKQHPNADRLRVCQVDTGQGVVEVVCGAPNARTGMIGVFAPTGTYIPGTGITLEARPVRGVVSNGMLVSERELELSDDHEGIIELPAKLGEQLGKRYADVMGLADPVFEVKLTPNRPDCTGVRGIARDLAAAGLGKLKAEKKVSGVEGDFECPVDIKLEFPKEARDACPCFAGRYLKGVKNGPAPAWMQQRLKAVGLRPINALVDVTNYISMDRGRPLHVYDADKLKGAIRARLGKKGETFAGPRRQDARGRRDHVRDRRRSRRARLRRHPRRRGDGLHRGDHERPHRVRLLRSAAHGRHRPQGRRAERCALPLRARRRPGLHPAGLDLATA
jgi:phenylalanyl-tRNA synthetase beta chain